VSDSSACIWSFFCSWNFRFFLNFFLGYFRSLFSSMSIENRVHCMILGWNVFTDFTKREKMEELWSFSTHVVVVIFIETHALIFKNCFLLRKGRLASWDFCFVLHSHNSWHPFGVCRGSRDRTRNCCVAAWTWPLSYHIPHALQYWGLTLPATKLKIWILAFFRFFHI
jgi:hypothetical protein